MTTARAARPAFDIDRTAGLPRAGEHRPADRLRAAPMASPRGVAGPASRRSLDARLAAGEPPERSRLLAVRTTHLVSPSSRRRIARRWDASRHLARAGLARTHLEVADEIQKVADLLRSDRPVGVHGVAVAITMSGVAADAVQRPGTGGVDVAAAVTRTALAAM